ncbi:uncharacterized protein LOC108627949 [Ceratina calcarata]|uniref:Uncharacterized protein LOC108627949 n=1 Tax=Ceratina calcarata TaxID=156304 RepID=A0AAJ7S703_9HYME|nr:uncharacterized protein LOC108627949 [Ceratina calcarata]
MPRSSVPPDCSCQGSSTSNAKTSSEESRKKQRIKNNAIGRKVIGGHSTTVASAPKRIITAKPKFRNSFSRPRPGVEDEEEEQRVDRPSYNQEEADTQGGNAVRATDKSETSDGKGARPKTRIGSNRNRGKQIPRKEEDKNESSEESLRNILTTPEPPTTPDPGTDFKCEDEGFFSYPRDCKKYFWCLDSGPGGLGVVAHQFTCPSGLVFNKGADSCEYPRNVICPKSKPSSSSSTIRARSTTRTTFLYSTTRQQTTEKPEEEGEHEYEKDDKELEEEEKEEPKPTTIPKPLLYKTITRNKPTTTTTTTTTEVPSTSRRSDPERVPHIEDEEDHGVIKELIQLIKKAGGIEQLEKQLLFQSKSSVDATSSNNKNATPATISRTLYERVLSRQRLGRKRTTSKRLRMGIGPVVRNSKA